MEATRRIPGGDKERLWRYRTVAERLRSPGLGEYDTYGLAAIATRGGEDVMVIHDISRDSRTIGQMAALFTARRLSVLHFRDVVEDMLP